MKPLVRWMPWLLWLGLAIAVIGSNAGCLDREWGDEPSTTVAELGPPDDPNRPHPDYGAPRQPLPANPAGWGSNQNGAQFPHYGRVEIRLCDLPRDFTTWSEGRQRKWCRQQLVDAGHAMPGQFTNHELLETRGNQKYLVVYKVDRADHSSSGRPRMYHPPDPNRGGRAYRGGIAQLRDVPAHHFQRRRPPRRPRPPPRTNAMAFDPGACGDTCDVCLECAATPDEAGGWCGESCPL